MPASRLTSLLGIELPVIQAPMAGVQDSALAIAVSNAGGLGSLPCALLSTDAIEQELRTITAGTDKPYNINFFCHQEPKLDSEIEQAWQALLAPYYREFEIDPATIPSGPGREPFGAAAASLLERFRPPVVSFHFGLPDVDLLARVRATGTRILSSATTVDEARWLEARGVDAIIAQGVQAGGHRGMFLTTDLASQVETQELLRQVLDAVSVPVIAAGGISTAEDVATVMQAGAAGVQVGTAYLLCPEARTSDLHRAALKKRPPSETAITNLITGRPARGIVNRLMRELGPLSDRAPAFPLATAAIVPLRQVAEQRGSSDFSPLWAGEDFANCREVSVAELTRSLGAILRRSGSAG